MILGVCLHYTPGWLCCSRNCYEWQVCWVIIKLSWMQRTTNHRSQLDRKFIFYGSDWTMDLDLNQKTYSDLPSKTQFPHKKGLRTHHTIAMLDTNDFAGFLLLSQLHCYFVIATIDDFPMECDDCNPIINPTTHNLTLKSSLEAFNYNVSRMTLIWMKTRQIGFVIIMIYLSSYIM